MTQREKALERAVALLCERIEVMHPRGLKDEGTKLRHAYDAGRAALAMPTSALPAEAMEFIRNGDRVRAVKLVREARGCSLREAYDLVQAVHL